MKKILTTVALAATLGCAMANAQDYSLTLDLTYESDYVFRGAWLADETLMPSIEIALDNFYAGIWSAQPLTGSYDNEVDFYAGWGFAVSDTFSIDAGGCVYYYPETDGSSTFEMFVGGAWDMDFSPAIYAYYDLDLEAFTLETSIGHSFEIDDQTSIDVAAYLGWVDPEGSSYFYYGASADVVYSINDMASASVGLRYADMEDGDDNFWFGASLTTGF